MKHPTPVHRRHDISEATWALLDPHLPGRNGA
jgi:transposase